MDLRPGERVDDLGRGGLRIIQHPGRFPFAMDPVLLAHFVKVRRSDRVLDLGTGCGVVPLLLSALHPEATCTGLELQPETAEMAARSVALNGLTDRVRIDCGDFRAVGRLYGHGKFDVVTMNPPYREPGRGKVSVSDARAAARHELAGTLAEAGVAAATAVKHGGRVAVVFLAERLTDLLVIMRANRLEPKRLRLVQARAGRPANLALLEAVKGGGPGLKVEPPLVVYQDGQTLTPEVLAIYNV
ncbi:MAG TPA: tRNA1(Val) (adenine(37)-N6)-methyltransferase [Symbiobacteriaceae bacterium]|jgi:tRNA1Val (adenine37-N6)-methyltransferase